MSKLDFAPMLDGGKRDVKQYKSLHVECYHGAEACGCPQTVLLCNETSTVDRIRALSEMRDFLSREINRLRGKAGA